MAREFKGALSADDIAWLKARYSTAYVERMVSLHGVKGKADSDEAQAKAEAKAREEQEKAEAAAEAQRQADEEAARAAEEDLIGASGGDGGDGAGDGSFDVLGSTESEVKAWVESATDEQKAEALAAEQSREDRDPRKGVVSFLS